MNTIGDVFAQTVLVVGRIMPEGLMLLGSGFIVNQQGLFVTARHVVGNDDKGLVVCKPTVSDFNSYQDASITQHECFPVTIQEINPICDLAILKTPWQISAMPWSIQGLDGIGIGDPIGIIGYPHANPQEMRKILTFQSADIGAKVLLQSEGIKVKHAIINTQARPGQSGSLIISLRHSTPTIHNVVGVLIGPFVAPIAHTVSGGLDSRTLHQTTQCVSAEYITNML